ncbi:hypothetical protein INS49_002405 [Diaporthe citri]|uniref:uncharacterized protein n=1 Tax=Diaporthe citri TaxID=83186 RepID=UPI001C81281B|nr:uncharacterized protein INS49_002405 [Diaporthe citri]KAG6368204.1 hypothetical protein INS49_002405 [Diaporthe citri]
MAERHSEDDDVYDYIIVGGGTAGLVVASRLSEDADVSVLVIEAGGDKTKDPFVMTPGLLGALYGKDEYDWNFLSVPQSIIDAWETIGNEGWNFETLAPYFRNSESGPLAISVGEGFGPNNSAWMDAFEELGLKMAADPRNGSAVGAFQQAANIEPVTKTRTSSASAYLTEEVRARPNLSILIDTVVSQVILNKSDDGASQAVATGVEIRFSNGVKRTIRASLEVVLAAGALQTPQILELSGIGDREILTKREVPVIVENGNVGRNLQDHPIVCESFEVADGVVSGDILRDPDLLKAIVAQYQSSQDGPLGQSIISSAYVPMADSSGILTMEARSNVSDYITPTEPENYITVMVFLNHPFSRGTCHIASPNVEDKPVWDPRYNSEKIDMELLASGVQFVEKLIGTEPFSSILKPNGKRLQSHVHDLESARDVVRSRQISVFHLSGSASMRPQSAGGVVDTRLRVYGVKNLRIVDASVFPLEPSGNIQSTVYAVAERAADILKEDRLKAK